MFSWRQAKYIADCGGKIAECRADAEVAAAGNAGAVGQKEGVFAAVVGRGSSGIVAVVVGEEDEIAGQQVIEDLRQRGVECLERFGKSAQTTTTNTNASSEDGKLSAYKVRANIWYFYQKRI